MKPPLFRAGAGALLLVAALFFLGSGENIAAVLLPIAAHEAGHLLALWLLGLPIRCFRIEFRGFCIEYGGSTGALGHAFAAATGPAAGILYAFAAARLAGRYGSDWLQLTAGVSLLLSFFNLLPALPLDGGRILLELSGALLGEKRGRLLTEAVGLIIGAGLLGGGLYWMLQGRGIALELTAIWLLLSQEGGRGLVKRPKMI